MADHRYLMDFSLGLVNRTGAFMICRDILQDLPHYFSQVRYWRFICKAIPDGYYTRRVLARLMMLELYALRGRNVAKWSDGSGVGSGRLILDPLYVLRSNLNSSDIVQCHDVGPITHPEAFHPAICSLYQEAYAKIKHVGPGMVFVSDTSQREFRRLYGNKFRFFQTIAQYTRRGIVDGTQHPLPGIEGRFLLTVGALELRKNHLRVLEAYKKSNLFRRGVKYVICGSRGKEADEILALGRSIPGVVMPGYVSDSQLRWLYKQASGFVLPSTLEGFGLPPLEAAENGLVSIVSAGGAQEEAIGASAVLVDPTSVDEITEALRVLIDMPEAERLSRVQRGIARGRILSRERFIAGWDKVLSRNDKFADTDGWAASDPEEAMLHHGAL